MKCCFDEEGQTMRTWINSSPEQKKRVGHGAVQFSTNAAVW